MNCDIAKHFYVLFFLKEGDTFCSHIIKTGDHEANTSQCSQLNWEKQFTSENIVCLFLILLVLSGNALDILHKVCEHTNSVTVLLVCPDRPPDVSVCWAHGLLFVPGAMCSPVYCLSPPILLPNHCFSCSTCSLVTLVYLPI